MGRRSRLLDGIQLHMTLNEKECSHARELRMWLWRRLLLTA